MKASSSSSSSCCNIHAKEMNVVGVCPLCLNERLLVLASQQRKRSPLSSTNNSIFNLHKLPPQSHHNPNNKPHRFFPFPSSFLGFFELQHHHHNRNNNNNNSKYDDHSFISPDDSFISIKFENNGTTSWEKGKVSRISLEHCKGSWDHNVMKGTKKEMMIQHPKSRASLRWRKRIGQILHVIRLRRPSACHVSPKVEGVDASSSWVIRPSTKNRTPN